MNEKFLKGEVDSSNSSGKSKSNKKKWYIEHEENQEIPKSEGEFLRFFF